MVGKYREVGRLAEGGMAIIAQAERDDGCVVVIKRVRPPFCFDPSFLRLFADEGAVHAALDHENIVHLLDKGEDEGGPFLVFEHVDGTDLGVVLESTKAPLDVECVLAVAIPLMKALAFVHESELHVVHRDVSPGNVLIGKDGCVKLADFGVASFTLKTEATVAGEMKGKFAYMAPEQSRGEKAGPKADLFAAGVVLWEALAGKRLFDGPTDADVVAAVRTMEAPPLDGPLGALVAQLLQKDPDKRPASARAVVKRLADIALELGFDEGLMRHAARLARCAPEREINVDERRRTQRVLGAEPLARRRRRAPLVPVLAAAGALFVVAAAGAFALRPDDGGGDDDDGTGTVTALPPTPAPAPAPAPVAPAPAPTLAAMTPLVPPHKAAHAASATTATGAESAARPAKAATTGAATATGTSTRRSVTLSRADAAPVVGGFGRVSISSDPWGEVWIDGKKVAQETPARGLMLPAGKHALRVVNPTFHLEKTVEIEVKPDATLKRFVDLNH